MVVDTRDIYLESMNPDLEHLIIRHSHTVEEPIIHLEGAGLSILTKDSKIRLASNSERRDTRKRQTSLRVQVQQFIKCTVSWLKLDVRNK
jgi:hypothetical protein